MAKSTGSSLNPGADSTLVAAAYRAGMANVPKDLSGTFEALASNYATTMKSVSSSWQEVAKNVGSLGRSAVDQAVTNLNNRAVVAGVSNKTNTTFLTDGLKDVKKNIYSTWKLRNEDGSINNPLSALNRSKRIEARQQRDKFFGQAKSITAGSTFLSENFANGTVDEKATGPRNLMLANGIQSLSTSSGKSEDGSYLKPSHDRDKNIIFTLYGADDKPITGFVNGKPVSIDGEEGVSVATDKINGLITPKNAEVAGGFNTLMTNMETNAKNSNTNATFDNFAPKLKNDMRPLIDTEDKLHGAMHASIYNFSETFADDLHNPEGSVTSATIFGMMDNTIPQDADGNPLPVDEMADGKAGITAADFTTGEAGAANYKMITNALTNKSNKFYNYDTTKEVFLGWAEQGAKTAFDYGAGQRKGAAGTATDGGFTNLNSRKSSEVNGAGGGYTPNNSLNYIGKSANDRLGIDMGGNKFTWNKEDNVYMLEGDSNPITNKYNLFRTIYGEGFEPNNILPMYNAIEDWGSQSKELQNVKNPFGDKSANQAPDEFIAAIDQGEEDTITYLESMGIKVKDLFGDKVEVEMNGKTKTFRVDPYSGNDSGVANKMWKWMFENYTKKKLK